jgi:XapX domain-containing protein
MKTYLFSLSAGLLVGIVYSLLQVRSPAPPMIALLGLLGILLGEQVVPVARSILAGEPLTLSLLGTQSAQHVFGELPDRHTLPRDRG